MDAMSKSSTYVSTGTTLVAMEYDRGVIIGTDSRTSAGSFIASRATNKITPITDGIVALRSGGAADTQAISDIVKYYVDLYSVMENEPVTVYRAAQIFRKFLFNYRDQLHASIIIAGCDDKKGGQIYSIPLGGFTTRQYFTASGSGGAYLNTFIDRNWKPGMTRDQVFQLVREAVFLAIHRDCGSGGVIRLSDITSAGITNYMFRPDRDEFPALNEPPVYSEPNRALQHLSKNI